MILGQRVDRILAYTDPVNLRMSFDGLLGLVKGNVGEDPLSGTLYVFMNRRRNYVKGIVWHRTGYVLLAKRLERGKYYFQESDHRQVLTEQAFALILDGIKLGVS
jgi:transposase